MKDKILEYVIYHKENTIKAIIVFAVILLGLFVSLGKDSPEEIVIEKNSAASVTSEDMILTGAGIEAVNYIYVDLSGAVNNPKVMKLQENTRVYQAIEMAGGLKPDADVSCINMAAKLKDENKIYIPKIGEKPVAPVLNNLNSKSGSDNPISGINSGINNNGQININTADSQQLQELSGVGPSTAEKIIRYREDQGSYLVIEDIKKVSGIGDKTFAKFKDKICI